jgi:hypothetical protein
MRKRILLISMAAGAAVLAIVMAVSAADGRRPRLTRVIDCIQTAGYRTTTAIHDDGRRSMAGRDPDVQLLFGSDGMMQVREPSDTFSVVNRDSTAIADISVPQSSAITLRQYHRLSDRTRITIESCLAS